MPKTLDINDEFYASRGAWFQLFKPRLEAESLESVVEKAFLAGFNFARFYNNLHKIDDEILPVNTRSDTGLTPRPRHNNYRPTQSSKNSRLDECIYGKKIIEDSLLKDFQQDAFDYIKELPQFDRFKNYKNSYDRAAIVLARRFGFYDSNPPMTFKDIGPLIENLNPNESKRGMGVSGSSVGLILNKTLRQLRHPNFTNRWKT